jgi:hypothetical protein
MSRIVPDLMFKLTRRRLPPATKNWLEEKQKYLSRTWTKKGYPILRGVERNCGFGFPARTISEGMTVYLHRRGKNDSLGDMEETKPLLFNIYLRKSDTWGNIKPTLIHELIHCLMWQKFYFDFRTRTPTLFADIFADELLASVVECLVLGRKPGPRTCKDAIEYALDEAIDRLSKTDKRQKLAAALVKFTREYKRKIKHRESNIIKEREEVLKKLPSLLPESL